MSIIARFRNTDRGPKFKNVSRDADHYPSETVLEIQAVLHCIKYNVLNSMNMDLYVTVSNL